MRKLDPPFFCAVAATGNGPTLLSKFCILTLRMFSKQKKKPDVIHLLQAPKQVLHRRIEFRKPTHKEAMDSVVAVEEKPMPFALQPAASLSRTNSVESLKLVKATSVGGTDVELESSNRLYPIERATRLMGWKEARKIGAGLDNLGNTCFFNSIMQCLTYTPMVANFCLSDEHTSRCHVEGEYCGMCELCRHVRRALQGEKRVYSPTPLVNKFRLIGKQFRVGRQEDAHEFLRYFIDSVQNSVLRNAKITAKDQKLARTSVVHSIFGGYLRSEVFCLNCKRKSWTYDPILDISLEIANADNVARALEMFTKPEKLDGDNKYKCEACKKLVPARKQFTIWQLPNVLVIQLKRFSFFGMSRGKLKKMVRYEKTIDMSHYVSADSKALQAIEGLTYSLHGVLVHQGDTAKCGHYYSFVKGPNGTWFEMNDSRVRPVSEAEVLNQQSYILFYSRNTHSSLPPPPVSLAPKLSAAPSTPNPHKKFGVADESGEVVVRQKSGETAANKIENKSEVPKFEESDGESEDEWNGKNSMVKIKLNGRKVGGYGWMKLLSPGNFLVQSNKRFRRGSSYVSFQSASDGDIDDEIPDENSKESSDEVSAKNPKRKIPEPRSIAQVVEGQASAKRKQSSSEESSSEEESDSDSSVQIFATHNGSTPKIKSKKEKVPKTAPAKFEPPAVKPTPKKAKLESESESESEMSDSDSDESSKAKPNPKKISATESSSDSDSDPADAPKSKSEKRIVAKAKRAVGELRNFGQFGTRVETWDGVDAKAVKKQGEIFRIPELQGYKKRQDEFDADLDKGKLKKVKTKKQVRSGERGREAARFTNIALAKSEAKKYFWDGRLQDSAAEFHGSSSGRRD